MKKLKIGETEEKIYSVKIDVFRMDIRVIKKRVDNLNYEYAAKYISGEDEDSVSSDRSSEVPREIRKRAEQRAIVLFKDEEYKERSEQNEMKRIGTKDPGQKSLFGIH